MSGKLLNLRFGAINIVTNITNPDFITFKNLFTN